MFHFALKHGIGTIRQHSIDNDKPFILFVESRIEKSCFTGFEEKFNKPVYEGYGTTETTPIAGVNVPDRLDTNSWHVQTGNKRGTVGLPLPGSSFRIVDPDTLEPLPSNEDGLILIGAGMHPLMLPARLIKTDAIPKPGTGKSDFKHAKTMALEAAG